MLREQLALRPGWMDPEIYAQTQIDKQSTNAIDENRIHKHNNHSLHVANSNRKYDDRIEIDVETSILSFVALEWL